MLWEVVVICTTVLLFRLLDHCVRALERRATTRQNPSPDWLDTEARLERVEAHLKGTEIQLASVQQLAHEVHERVERNTTQLGLMNLSKRPETAR